MLSMSRCLVDDVEVYRSTRLRLISFTISYYFPFLFNPVACESCPHIFDFTLPQSSYHARSTSTRLSPSKIGIRLYSDVTVRNKVEEESDPYIQPRLEGHHLHTVHQSHVPRTITELDPTSLKAKYLV